MITLDQIRQATLWDEFICPACGECCDEPSQNETCPDCASPHLVRASTALFLIESLEGEE